MERVRFQHICVVRESRYGVVECCVLTTCVCLCLYFSFFSPVGYFKEDAFRMLIPPSTPRIFMCGPPLFQASVTKLLRQIGHTKHMTM